MAEDPLRSVPPSPAELQRSRMAGSNSLMPGSGPQVGGPLPYQDYAAIAAQQQGDREREERLAQQRGAQMSLTAPGFSYNDGALEHLTVRIDTSRMGIRSPSGSVGRNYRLDADGKITWDEGGGPMPFMKMGQGLNTYWSMPEQSRANVQRLLVRAGLLDPEAVQGRWGKLDPGGRDHQAWAQILTMSARTGKEAFSLLEEFAEGMTLEEAMSAGQPKPPRRPDIQLLSPEDIEAAADELGQELMGRKLTAAEKRRVTGKLHALQRQQQSAMIDVQMSETGGGELVQPTSPQVAIENQLREEHATEVQGTEQVRQFGELLQMLGGGS